jgi:hypothetical protein
LPGKKIKNYRLSVLNGKDQQKNEKDDYGDQFSTHLLSPLFLLSFHPLEGTLSLVENLLRALCLISQAMTQLFFEHKEITYPPSQRATGFKTVDECEVGIPRSSLGA